MSESKELGRFGHHPDPAIDYCVEVEEIEAIATDRDLKFANPNDSELESRVLRALGFRVGGDLHAINAKDRVRKIAAALEDESMERADRIRAAAPELYGQHEANIVDLQMLRRAIEEGDPANELLIRVDDLLKFSRAALLKATPEQSDV